MFPNIALSTKSNYNRKVNALSAARMATLQTNANKRCSATNATRKAILQQTALQTRVALAATTITGPRTTNISSAMGQLLKLEVLSTISANR